MYELKSIEESLLPIVEADSFELVFTNGQYSIKDFDLVKTRLEQMSEQINQYRYQQEDRQAVKKFKAAVNKYSKGFTAQVKLVQTELFGQVTKQQREIAGLMSNMSAQLDVGLKADDARLKAEKLSALEQAFGSAKRNHTIIASTDVTLEQVMSSSWLNLSTSLSSAINELDARLHVLSNLCGNPANPESSIEKNIQALNRSNWDGLQALGFILEQRAVEARAQEELELKKLAQEQSLSKVKVIDEVVDEEKIIESTALNRKATIIINEQDLKKVESILKQLKVDYKVVI